MQLLAFTYQAAWSTELRNERYAVLYGGDGCASSATSGSRPPARAPAGSGSRRSGRRSTASSRSGGATLIARFTEVESGRNPDRPELGKALHLAKVTGATLVIAKLDRLSRNAAFLLTLRDSGVRFAAVDLPEANDLTVGIMALVAQQEREAISKRTKEALAVARSRGVRLGNPNGAAALRRAGKGGAPLRAAIARNADRHAAGPRAGGRGHPRWWSDQPAGDRGRAQRSGHADPPRRPLARLDGHEPVALAVADVVVGLVMEGGGDLRVGEGASVGVRQGSAHQGEGRTRGV